MLWLEKSKRYDMLLLSAKLDQHKFPMVTANVICLT